MSYPYKEITIDKVKRNGNCQYCTKKKSDLLLAFYDGKYKYGFSQAIPICDGCLNKKAHTFPPIKGYYFATRNKGEFYYNILDLFVVPYRGYIKDRPGLKFNRIDKQKLL